MGSAIKARDLSVNWPVHTCGARHPAVAACPPLGTWLADWVAGDPAREVAVRQRLRVVR